MGTAGRMMRFRNFSKTFEQRYRLFCQETSLHGWKYLIDQPLSSWRTAFWIVTLSFFGGLCAHFVHTNLRSFIDSKISTTIETTTTSLNELDFPSVTFCNINQVQASFMAELGIYNNFTKRNAVYNEYIGGGAPMEKQKEIIRKITWFRNRHEKELLFEKAYGYHARQDCGDFVVSVDFAGKLMYWEELGSYYGAQMVGTDYGFCCIVVPQICFEKRREIEGIPSKGTFKKGIKNGAHNGISVLLDIENFNFAYHRQSKEGVMTAVHDYDTKPIIEMDGILSKPGEEARIALRHAMIICSHLSL